MKYFVSIICLCIALLMIGCASTGGGNVNRSWDKAFSERNINTDILYNGYNPKFEDYRETSLREASMLIHDNMNNRTNFDGYFFTENLVVTGINRNGINVAKPEDLQNLNQLNFRMLLAEGRGELLMYNHDLSSQLEQMSIITVWYRGINRSWKNRSGWGDAYGGGNGLFLDKFEITGQFVKEATATDIAIAEREAERQQSRFSPEGQEYVKKTLIQAVGEANNSANRGKTLFFETSNVSVKEGVTTGQWFISELYGSNSPTIMYYYDRVPWSLTGYIILYRVEISNIGVIRYVIDSFRE